METYTPSKWFVDLSFDDAKAIWAKAFISLRDDSDNVVARTELRGVSPEKDGWFTAPLTLFRSISGSALVWSVVIETEGGKLFYRVDWTKSSGGPTGLPVKPNGGDICVSWDLQRGVINRVS